MDQPVFTQQDLFTLATAVHTMAILYKRNKVSPVAIAEMERMDGIMQKYLNEE